MGWHHAAVATTRRLTVEIEEDLVDRARQGLERVAAGRAHEGLEALRGKVRLSLDLARLREDR